MAGLPPDFLQIPGQSNKPSFTAGSEESIRLGSRVTFTDQTVNFENGTSESQQISFAVEQENVEREEWATKTQFYMGIVSYAVGLGNVWRFPYLLQKNGGGAFLIPYVVMMILGGLPLFLIELGIGQRLRTGPVGVWSAIHPYLGGLGISSAIVSYFVAMYYNVIVTWCLYYLFQSLTTTLPWSQCPFENGTAIPECANQSTPAYYFNHEALQTTSSIDEFGGLNYRIFLALTFAWIIVYLCVKKGIKSSGNVMYVTAIFPYIVTFIFLFRSLSLVGAWEGVRYMFKPDLTKLYSPVVWLEAATQIFYSMGLGFGGLIAFGSYNPVKNDVKRDSILLSGVNLFTSILTAINVFCVLGSMAYTTISKCIERDMHTFSKVYPLYFPTYADVRKTFTNSEYIEMIENKFTGQYTMMAAHSEMCDFKQTLNEAAEGAGLAFVVFTEAILQFPMPPIWSCLFFLMLLSLGLGSMFGTLEGVITSLNDSKLINVKKPVLTFILCLSALIVGIPFASRSGQYWVSLFDNFAGSYALMCVAFFEIIAVSYVYGAQRFSDDIEYMTGSRPGLYWQWTWKFFAPAIMLVLFSASVLQTLSKPVTYIAYDPQTAKQMEVGYPTWAMYIAIAMVTIAIAPTLGIWFLRYFRIWKLEANIPVASKCLNTTQSTTQMLKSDVSFNHINDSSATVSEMVPFTANVEQNQ
ncbi:unnamed protein product [Caenorhabditis auriculariae]|uniref:Transporter n=1 Tax=Caenorhabditis auriculariae TaxID=2777116 RepID=A0A8S1GS83_9PELO|nr:unnamed protein product [Caenorhabditis auriculariae]